MPTYEYQCKACGHALEAFQRMSDDPLKDCPSCGKSALEKQISASGFQLKGSGWYQTDFKSKPAKKAEGETAGGTAKSESTPVKSDGE